MSEFYAFLRMGFKHISSPEAYDHILFIVTLCAVYRREEWRKILVLVTAFTIGHSLTLLLSGFNILQVPAAFVEFLIPLTILITSLHNVWAKKAEGGTFSKAVATNYGLALFFGLIHGMGFANFFRALKGEEGGIVQPLFAFNVGIEMGQMMVVGLFFLMNFALTRIFDIKHRDWNLYISGLGGGGALVLILQGMMP